MSTYGRNFELRTTPDGPEREGRWAVPNTGNVLPIGAPVVANWAAAVNTLGLPLLELAPADTAKAAAPAKGIVLYEYGPAAYAGHDPALTTYSDLDTVPLGQAAQLLRGQGIKFVLRNTVARTFLNTRAYPGRVMIDLGAGAGVGALAVGDFICPGTGTDVAGYWHKAADEAHGWAYVTSVDTLRAEVEARLLF